MSYFTSDYDPQCEYCGGPINTATQTCRSCCEEHEPEE